MRTAAVVDFVLFVVGVGAVLTGCGGLGRKGAESEAATTVTPTVTGQVEHLDQEVKVLQKQVTSQENVFDLSRNQLKDREMQYSKQMDLMKGFVFFLAGLCVVMFLAPAPSSRWCGVLMIGSLATTMVLLGVWLFRV